MGGSAALIKSGLNPRGIVILKCSAMVEKVSFSSLGLKDWLVKQVSAVGFKDPKPVQIHCIPPILEGKVVKNHERGVLLQ